MTCSADLAVTGKLQVANIGKHRRLHCDVLVGVVVEGQQHDQQYSCDFVLRLTMQTALPQWLA